MADPAPDTTPAQIPLKGLPSNYGFAVPTSLPSDYTQTGPLDFANQRVGDFLVPGKARQLFQPPTGDSSPQVTPSLDHVLANPAPSTPVVPTTPPPAGTNIDQYLPPELRGIGPAVDHVKKGESGGYPDPYHLISGGGHFGFPAGVKVGAGPYQDIPSTWTGMAIDYRKRFGGPDLNFNNWLDVEKGNRLRMVKDYAIDKNGRNLQQAIAAGQVDYSRLPDWAQSLGPKAGYGGMLDAAAEEGKKAHSERERLANEERTALSDLQKQISALAPDSTERHKLVAEQLERSQKLQDQLLDMARHPPQQTPTDLMSAFGSIAMLVAAIGGSRSRQPATASLNAAAGVIEGFNTNNKETFERNFKVWEAQSGVLKDVLGYQRDTFHDIMENERLDATERLEQIREKLQFFDMQHGLRMLDAGNADGLYKMLLDLPKHYADLDKAQAEAAAAWGLAHYREQGGPGGTTPMVDEGRKDAQGNPTIYYQPKNGPPYTLIENADGTTSQEPYTPVNPRKVGTESQANLPPFQAPDTWQGAPNTPPPGMDPTAWSNAVAYVLTEAKPPLGWGNNQQRQMFNQAIPIVQKALGITPTEQGDIWKNYKGEVARRTSIERAVGGGVLGRNIISLNTVADHLALLRKYADALENRDIVAINQIKNRMATQAGWPEVIDYALAGKITGDEVVRLLTTTGGTVADREGIERLLGPYGSPEQLHGAVNTLENYISARYAPLRQWYAGNDPTRRDSFDNDIMTPEARALVKEPPHLTSGPQREATPPRPSSVPDGSAYSPSRNQWRSPDGQLYDSSGKPL